MPSPPPCTLDSRESTRLPAIVVLSLFDAHSNICQVLIQLHQRAQEHALYITSVIRFFE